MTLAPVPHVPRLQAEAVEAENRSGRTVPVAMWCRDSVALQSCQYMVKLWSSVELQTRSLARELFAALLAAVLRLQVPKAAVVEISANLHRSVPNPELGKRLRSSIGANFGSEIVTPAVIYRSLDQNHIEQAVDVFAFDMLLQNPDRRRDKPNMFQNGNGLIVFDHEMAFPYADPRMMLGIKVRPWDIARGTPWVTNHILHAPLQRQAQSVTFGSFINRLNALSDDILSEILSRIPPEWITANPPEMDNICEFIREGRDNSARFERSLLEVIA